MLFLFNATGAPNWFGFYLIFGLVDCRYLSGISVWFDHKLVINLKVINMLVKIFNFVH